MHFARALWLIILLCFIDCVDGQASAYKRLTAIEINGNKRTKESLIKRELTHRIGDLIEINALDSLCRANENLLQNTSLFNTVEVTFEEDALNLIMNITLTERWYFFPSPIFTLIDRNINDWWITHEGDLSRTRYGLDLRHFNLTGRNDHIDLNFQLGYTKKFGFTYRIPYLGERQKYGLEVKSIYSTQREYNTKSENNKQVFYQHDDILSRKLETRLKVSKRKNYKNGESLDIAYESVFLDDTIKTLAPDLLLDGRNKQQFFSFTYRLTKDSRDRSSYPLEGRYLEFLASKVGLGIFEDINYAYATFNWAYFKKHNEKLYSIVNARVKTSFPSIQPYHNQEGLGYGSSVLRGYELYVVDGQHFGLFRSAIKYRLAHLDFKLPFKDLYQFSDIPISFYLKGFSEAGYVVDRYYDEFNSLNNSWLGSIGLGLDVVTFYDFVIGFEVSHNRLKENNLFLSVNFNY